MAKKKAPNKTIIFHCDMKDQGEIVWHKDKPYKILREDITTEHGLCHEIEAEHTDEQSPTCWLPKSELADGSFCTIKEVE